MSSGAPVSIFFSYAHEDEAHRLALEQHLGALRFQGRIATWWDGEIRPGEEWDPQIRAALESADIVLLLVSRHFLSSTFSLSVEMRRALERHERGDARVVPVLVRSVDWAGMPFEKLQMLPSEARPVDQWPDPEHAYADIARGVRRSIEELLGSSRRRDRAEARRRIWNVPYERNLHFAGREDLLATLGRALERDRASALTQAVTGLGGIGKTQLAVEYAYRHRDHYDVLWWVRAEDPTTLASDYARLAEELGLPSASAAIDDQVAAVRRWLDERGRWLVIFDNAEAARDLEAYRPRTGTGHVLITSRNPSWRGAAEPIDVPILEREASIRFLIDRCGKTDAAGAARVAEAMGDLPLALEQAGAYVEQTGISFGAYLEAFRRRQRDVLARASNVTGDVTIATTWELSFQRVEEQSEGATALLRLCAFLAPEAIPLDLLERAGDALPRPLATLVADHLALNDAVGVLRRYALATREENSLSVHRLVQAVTRDRLSANERTMWLEATVVAVGSAFPQEPEHPSSWPQGARLAPHALAVTSHADTRLTARLLRILDRYFSSRGSYAQALDAGERALRICRTKLGAEHQDTLVSMGNLAATYSDLGRHEDALALKEQVLDLRRTILGHEHPDTLRSLSNLAATYSDLGRYEDALALKEQVLDLRRTILGHEHPATLTSMNNLAATYSDLGRHEDALALKEQVLDLRRTILGHEHPATLTSMNNLAATYSDLGRHEDALALKEQVLDLRRTILGHEHPATLTSMNNLAATYSDLGRHEDALALKEQVLDLRRTILGHEHPDTLRSLSNLAATYRGLGRHDDALALIEQVLDLRRTILGHEHPDTLRSMSNLAATYRDLGRHDDALALIEQVLDLHRTILGREHPDTLTSMSNLAATCNDLGRHEDALALNEQVLDLRRRILGHEHPDTLSSMASLAVSEWHLTNFEAARTLEEQVVAGRRRVLGDDHPRTRAAIENLAVTLRSLGRNDQAAELEAQASGSSRVKPSPPN